MNIADFSVILIWFLKDYPAFIICVLYLLMYFKDLKPIKENLSNHITDTNKKIDKLESKFESKFENWKQDQKEILKLLSEKK